MRHIAFIFFLAYTSMAISAPLTSADQVNLAGRQRMLTQRIVKAYVQIGVNLVPDQSKRMLTDSIDQFSTQLKHLRTIVDTPEQLILLADIDQLWPQFQYSATVPVNRQFAGVLNDQATKLETVCHRLVGLIEINGGIASGRLVNLAGRQRMLSQRLAKAYMLRAWDLDTPQINSELQTSRAEFAAGLISLIQAPENTAEIRRELELIATQWNWFQAALELEGAMSYQLVVADSSEAILVSIEKLVTLYTGLDR